MNVHFIAIGGSVMHQLAIALRRKGYVVTGSDDEIFEPAKTNLEKEGILPAAVGWFPEKIHSGLDAVILGMHARADNPELIRAEELALSIYSFPEYIYKESLGKTRVVVGGSHGKTTTTSMIMNVLKANNKDFDWLVGARLEGFSQSVQITDAPVIVCEGDEYPASALEKRPKFHFLFPHIAILTGIAWDHINVFPTFEIYLEQFRIFLDKIEPDGVLIYNQTDPELVKLVKGYLEERERQAEQDAASGRAKESGNVSGKELEHESGPQGGKSSGVGAAKESKLQTGKEFAQEAGKMLGKERATFKTIGYEIPSYKIENGITVVELEGQKGALKVFGEHNLLNLHAAFLACKELGIDAAGFLKGIGAFAGAAKRLELMEKSESVNVYRDFAHAPSKVKATIEAVKKQFPERRLIAVLELHTYSSLNEKFLSEYRGALALADAAAVFYSKHALELKRLPLLPAEKVVAGFDKPGLAVINEKEELSAWLMKESYKNANLLFMSSGNYDGLDIAGLSQRLLH